MSGRFSSWLLDSFPWPRTAQPRVWGRLGRGYPWRREASMSRSGAVRVLVVDDHDLFRTGLRALLEEEGFEAAESPSGKAALAALPSFRPDVVVMDMSMPGMSGIEATAQVRKAMPEVPVLVLTINREEESVLEAVRAGASGYLLKDAELDEIVAAIRAAAGGRSVLGAAAADAVMAHVRRETPGALAPPPAPDLTPREREVLVLLARGCDNATISRRLFMSPSTVKHHVSRVLEKLGVENRLQAAAFAIRHGLADENGDSG
jgi:DNA-binding NarL/FixJ family response regulator